MSKSVVRKMGVMVAAGVGVIVVAVVIATSQMGSTASPAAGQPAAARSAAAGSSSGNSSATSSAQLGAAAGSTSAGGAAAVSASGTSAATGQSSHSSAPGGTGAATPPPTAARTTTPPTTGKSTTTAPPAAGPAAAALGTYRYHQVGTLAGTPSEGTLMVTAGSGAGTQVWTRNVGGALPPASTNMLFNASGAFLLTPSDPVTGTASCTFARPVPWPPYPTTPGQSASVQAACTAPITTYQVSSQVQGTTQVSLGGTSVTAAVVVNTFVIKGNYNGGAINVTLTETDEYAPNLAVPVVTTTRMSGTALGLSVTTQRTDTLESANPS
ncbi:MAG: hypothetical protein ACRDZ8_12325 [Acidimicrobiales bacterium]